MMNVRLHVKKNDLVQVISGKEKGKTGKILRALPKQYKVIVEKLNMVKKHTKPTQKNPQGGIVQKEMPIHVSNVKRVDVQKKSTEKTKK
ncbi:MAG: 50S ribosomal protein L24 [Deltaproteobacteria bacterium RIFCSPHIGHO2_02_FULL_40_11]|nr:MAG: 50S ribosomal protein L24 [Deltaproteobacteria bacterium RIFCSPHIGHO2_02_FULL_40_11]